MYTVCVQYLFYPTALREENSVVALNLNNVALHSGKFMKNRVERANNGQRVMGHRLLFVTQCPTGGVCTLSALDLSCLDLVYDCYLIISALYL